MLQSLWARPDRYDRVICILYRCITVIQYITVSSGMCDSAEHGSRVASSYQTLQFFMWFTYYFAVFHTGCLHSYCLRQTHTHFPKSAPLSHIGNHTLSSLMPALYLQTQHQSPLSGPHDRDEGNVTKKEGRELTSSSDWDAVPFDLLSQPFCWAHLIPTRNKRLLRYLPHRNLDVCNGSRLSHRAHGVLRASLGQNERAHREMQRWGRLFLYQKLVVWWKEPTLY